MRIIRSVKALQAAIRRIKRKGETLGLVPTMGAFHEGHLSLIRRARAETDRVVVSLFVNPLQFNRHADLVSYPRVQRADAREAARAGVDILFIPTARSMYPPDFQTFVEVTRLSRPWEGRFRPGHFRGVTTVVTKLFHLVQPDHTYFGRKDAQQARIVQQLIRDLNFPIRLHLLPTRREKDGLAMSSRNRLLSSEARQSSRALFEALQEAQRLIKWGQRRASLLVRRMRARLRQVVGARIEYVAVVEPKTLLPVRRLKGTVWILMAVWVGKVRLIDGCAVRCKE